MRAKDEIDLFFGKFQFQESRVLFVSLNKISDFIVQPRRQESNPLRIADEQIDIPADSVAQFEHQPGSAPKKRRQATAFGGGFRIGHDIGGFFFETLPVT